MVLVFAENSNGKFKKAAYETVTYGRKTADMLGTDCVAVIIGQAENPGELGKYGASSVVNINHDHLNSFDSKNYASAIAQVAKAKSANVVILNQNTTGVNITGRIAVRLNASCVSGTNALPKVDGDSLIVDKNIFSGKAISLVSLSGDHKVISVIGNTIQPEELGSDCDVEQMDVELSAPSVTVVSRDQKTGGPAPLPEAELVVSAGRGMKGPENWGIIEDLANTIGATTACSRPVADTGWRPHHEHVGQTGVAIRPNLYFAIGISGAIQHLAGVNSSKVIVVINKDPEAPFFKAADYGVCADLFDVVPKLTAALKASQG
jgi:electron transfer flavoprotein alpha subunit